MDIVYFMLKPLLFHMDPEEAHELVSLLSRSLKYAPGSHFLTEKLFSYQSKRLQTQVSGISFPNPVGLAAGYDKTGELYSMLSMLGFGSIEVGTFTALEQPGNPRPRLFRLIEHEAIINRMGFNNPGAAKAAKILSKLNRKVPLGVNIGKSKVVDVGAAAADYIDSLLQLAPFSDYITINVSSPNTPGLRRLQEKANLHDLLATIMKESAKLKRPVPIFLKIAPDLSEKDIDDIVEVISQVRPQGLIISNTTLDHMGISSEQGGLSGAPLKNKSTELIRKFYKKTDGQFPIIGVGGIMSPSDALEKIKAGASLIQIYTGLIYRGPMFPGNVNRFLDEYLYKENTTLTRLTGSDA